MINDEADEVRKELFDSSKKRYQNNLESMKDSEFFFDYVQLLHYCIQILLRGINSTHHGGLYCLNCLQSFATEKKL